MYQQTSSPADLVPDVPTAAPLSAGLLGLQDAVDVLLAEPASGGTAGLSALLVLTERLRGRVLVELGECDARQAFALDTGTRAVSAAGWLRERLLVGEDAARSTVRLASRLREDLPALADELLAGSLTLEHVQAVAQATSGLDPELVAAAAPALVVLARTEDPASIRRTLRERAESIDPALAEDAARRAHDRRGLQVTPLGRVGVAVSGSLTSEDGAVLLHGLDLALEASRVEGDTRSLAARRADVVVGWARTAAAALAGPGDSLAQDAHTVRTHLLVTCTADQLDAMGRAEGQAALFGTAALDVLTGATRSCAATLSTGATLVPAALRRLACDATISLVAMADPAARTGVADPLHVGRSARTISGAQFRAPVVRDRTCVVKGCHARPAQCAGHHVRHWADGGATDLDNLVLLCHRHHHDHHDRGQDLEHRDGRRLTRTGWGGAP